MEHRVRNLEEALSEKNKEIEKLQQELEATKKINQNLIESRYYINGMMPFLQHYTPNAQIPTHDRKPFQEQIDFSQIRLRKSNSNFMTEGLSSSFPFPISLSLSLPLISLLLSPLLSLSFQRKRKRKLMLGGE